MHTHTYRFDVSCSIDGPRCDVAFPFGSILSSLFSAPCFAPSLVDPTWDRHQGASRAFRGFFLTRSAKGPRKRESGSNNRKVVLV
jgi:hypothetical protein